VITQHGKGSAVLLDVNDYEQMIETIEILQEINQAREELAAGKGIPHEEVMTYMRDRYKVNT
jgi:PHD/YefM family antitoxin component YafN of YafNO toxin-antitoxin module